MRAWAAELHTTELTRALLDATVQLTPLAPPQRALGRLFVLATLSTVPDHLHELLAPGERRLEEQEGLLDVAGKSGPDGCVAFADTRAQMRRDV